VPATFAYTYDSKTGLTKPTVTIDNATCDFTDLTYPGMLGPIKSILRVNSSVAMSGVDYYVSPLMPDGDPYSGAPIELDPASPNLPKTSMATVYVSYRPNYDFGPTGEWIALKTALLPTGMQTTPKKVYIAYYPPGILDPMLYSYANGSSDPKGNLALTSVSSSSSQKPSTSGLRYCPTPSTRATSSSI